MTRSLYDISRELKRLASGDSQGERAVRDLAASLQRSDRAYLAGVNLMATYEPAVMLPDGKPWWRWLANGLELLRDVLIFVPVIYTWWKISLALKAYDEYTGAAPFLLAWQQGFDNRAEPLATSALVVAGVVLVVIFLTIIAHLVRASYDRSVQQRQQLLAVLLGEASVVISQSLLAGSTNVSRADLTTIGTQMAASAQSLQEALSKSSADIVAAVNTSPGSRLHDMFERWTAAARELSEFGNRLQHTEETVTQLRETQTALAAMAQQIGGETQRLLNAFALERDLSRQADHAHRDVADTVRASAVHLEDALKGLNNRAVEFQELILRLVYVVDRIDGGVYQ